MFDPVFTLTPKITNCLTQMEVTRQIIDLLPISPRVINSLRRTAKLMTTHYSTEIEGNELTLKEVERVVEGGKSVSSGSRVNKKRDEKEVLGYYEALNEVEYIVKNNLILSENIIKKLHSLIVNGGNRRRKPTQYRDGQNVIRDSNTGKIVYMPPEAKDVSIMMKQLLEWIINNMNDKVLPCPVIAGIAHYQIATIHPYYDGNGRLARILATLVLHLGGYGLKGIYSLEEYYSENLGKYYEAISIGESHNYYMGREKSDITSWIEYFCEGMSVALDKVKLNIQSSVSKEEGGGANNAKTKKVATAFSKNKNRLLRELDHKQRRVLELFVDNAEISSKDIEKIFPFKPRTIRKFCRGWCEDGFLKTSDCSKKNRKYRLGDKWVGFFESF